MRCDNGLDVSESVVTEFGRCIVAVVNLRRESGCIDRWTRCEGIKERGVRQKASVDGDVRAGETKLMGRNTNTGRNVCAVDDELPPSPISPTKCLRRR